MKICRLLPFLALSIGLCVPGPEDGLSGKKELLFPSQMNIY